MANSRDDAVQLAAVIERVVMPPDGAPSDYVKLDAASWYMVIDALRSEKPAIPNGWKLVCEKCGADYDSPCGWPAKCEVERPSPQTEKPAMSDGQMNEIIERCAEVAKWHFSKDHASYTAPMRNGAVIADAIRSLLRPAVGEEKQR